MFTDIVGSTERASGLGDSRWRQLLAEHDMVVRSELARWRGTEVKTIGDGFLATFDGPARAVHCAAEIVEAIEPLGLTVRAGLHTGRMRARRAMTSPGSPSISGHASWRYADAGEVLASSTVKDLVVGSGLQFDDRGLHALKGVPDEWRLYALER